MRPLLLTDAAVSYGAPHERAVGNAGGNRGRASVEFHSKLAHSALVVKLGRALAVEHEPELTVDALRSSDFVVGPNARHAVVGDPMDRITVNGALGGGFIVSAADARSVDKKCREDQRSLRRG